MVEHMYETFRGGVDTVSDRLLTGWLATRPFEDAPAELEFLIDGKLIGTRVAEQDGFGRLSFEFILPRSLFDGAAHEIGLRVKGKKVVLSNAVQVLAPLAGAAPQPAAAPPAMPLPLPLRAKGWVENVSEDGWVTGWACYPEAPEIQVELEFLVDGYPAGSTVAALLRPDVKEAGISGGYCGFSWPLPFSALSLARDVTVSVRDKRNGEPIPKPSVFRKKAVADAFSKIAELESDVRLLNETITALERRGAQDERATTELFRTVGNFFSELAAASASGAPLSQWRLPAPGAAPAGVAALEPFAFPQLAAPEVTVFLESGASLEASHAVLRALRDGMGETPAEIFLIDDGACEDMPLLPMLVGNLRYARLPGRLQVARRNAAMRLAAAPIVVCLAAGVALGQGWPDALAAFARRPDLAVLAARVTGPDAALLSAGVALQKARPVQRGRWTELRGGVDAAAPECFAVRREAWQALAGLDENFAGMAAALVELCLRAREAGHAVAYEPSFAAVLGQGVAALAADPQGDDEDASRLREIIGTYQEAAE
jgi:hypothetical protein